jgi:hypothetical protein
MFELIFGALAVLVIIHAFCRGSLKPRSIRDVERDMSELSQEIDDLSVKLDREQAINRELQGYLEAFRAEQASIPPITNVPRVSRQRPTREVDLSG